MTKSSALRAVTLTLVLTWMAGTPVLAQDICPQCIAWNLCCNQFMQECVTCQGARPSAPLLKHPLLASSSYFHEFLMLDSQASSAGGTADRCPIGAGRTARRENGETKR